MGTIMVATCWSLVVFAGTVQEPRTGVEFADTLVLDKGTVVCTGVDVRTKWMVKIYAIAHYGDPASAPKDLPPEERLNQWIDAKVLKAFVLKFTYGIDAKKMREACDEGFDNANYHGKSREPFLATLQGELKRGDEFRLAARPDGILTAEHNGSILGTWQDPELIRALWTIWMGEKSPLSKRETLVSR